MSIGIRRILPVSVTMQTLFHLRALATYPTYTDFPTRSRWGVWLTSEMSPQRDISNSGPRMLNSFNLSNITIAFSSCVSRWWNGWKFLEHWHFSQAVETRPCHWGSTKPALTPGAVRKKLFSHSPSNPAWTCSLTSTQGFSTAKHLRKH